MATRLLDEETGKKYDPENMQRVTDCCGAYSTYHDQTLCCKRCWNEVEIGEGDGNEFFTEEHQRKWEAGL